MNVSTLSEKPSSRSTTKSREALKPGKPNARLPPLSLPILLRVSRMSSNLRCLLATADQANSSRGGGMQGTLLLGLDAGFELIGDRALLAGEAS